MMPTDPFNDYPDQCAGCGKTGPPTVLRPHYVAGLDAYLCVICRNTYITWDTAYVKPGEARESYKPQIVHNVENGTFDGDHLSDRC